MLLSVLQLHLVAAALRADFTLDGNGPKCICDALGNWNCNAAQAQVQCVPVRCAASGDPGLQYQQPSTFPAGRYQDEFSFECRPGFDASNQQPYTCGKDGQWSGGSLTCTGAPCPAQQMVQPYADGVAGGRCPAGSLGGPDCTLQCAAGYTASDVRPFVCGADGTWASGSITCTAVTCPAGPPAEHASPCPAGKYDPLRPSNCSITSCAPGFHNISGDGKFVCGIKNKCTEKGIGDHVACAFAVSGSIHFPFTTGTYYLTDGICNGFPTYELKGATQALLYRQSAAYNNHNWVIAANCNAAVHWIDDYAHHRRQSCTSPNCTASLGKWREQHSVPGKSFDCPNADDNGWCPAPTIKIVAAVGGGSWVPDGAGGGLQCAAECPASNPLPSGPHIASGCPHGTHGGPTCTLRCAVGFKASNVQPFVCSKDGNWDGGSITCTAVTCPAGRPAAHGSPCPAGVYDPSHPSECPVTCDIGYHTNSKFVCGSAGRWVPDFDPDSMNCEQTAQAYCNSTRSDSFRCSVCIGEHQQALQTAGCNQTSLQTFCQPPLHTNSGGSGNGMRARARSMVCAANQCNASHPLPSEPHVAHGCPNVTYGGPTCTLQCAAGYKASNVQPFVCGADGRWGGGSITCTAVTCPAGRPSLLTMHRSRKGVYCSLNQKGVLKKFPAQTESVADLTAALEACEAFCEASAACNACSVDCVGPTPPSPSNPCSWVSRLPPGFFCCIYLIAQLLCLRQNAIPACLGTYGRWPGAIPGDISTQAQQPASPCPAGKYDALHPSKCSSVCDTGYHNSSGDGMFICGSSGRWVPKVPGGGLRCVGNECPASNPLPSAPHIAQGCPNGTYGGPNCTLRCAAGYKASNVQPFVCGADGRWGGGSITCTAVTCPAGRPAAHASPCPAGKYDAWHPSNCSSVCDTGYHYRNSSGDGTFVCGITPAASLFGSTVAASLFGVHQLQPVTDRTVSPAIDRSEVHMRHCNSVVYVTRYSSGVPGPGPTDDFRWSFEKALNGKSGVSIRATTAC
eukprot:COSAG01_NODE_4797_length_4738_cov_3.438672_1_plen_1018_part_10